jgi:acetoin:2,6-dichlorophenolindophenol oxidoreductase subunit beta
MTRTLTYAEALAEALVQGMERDPNVFVCGIGVDDHKGIFGTTRAAFERFGPTRVFDVPIAEQALTGVAIGAALMGKRPVIVHARNDFMFLATDQMINLAAKARYMYGGRLRVPMVVRSIIGKGWGQGATHSQSLQALFGHFPGLQVVMPALPRDAKGLTLAALSAGGPVVVLEHRALYDTRGPVPEAADATPIGTAAVVRQGRDVTIAATSLMVIEALRAAETLAPLGIEVEVVDCRSIRPFDRDTLLASLARTGRVIVADTSWVSFGVASEVASVCAEDGFRDLRAPVRRIGLADCPAPVSLSLERAFYPDSRTIARECLALLERELELDELAPAVDSFRGPY